MVEKYRQVLCSAPTHVAVDNFAARLDKRTRAMTKALNQGREQNDPNRYRHRLVIRAYRLNAEVGAFTALLKDPTLGDEAAPKGWGHASRWKLHLSLAFWFLAILGSPAVRELHPDDSEGLWDLRHQTDRFPQLRRLRDVATGVTTWEQYEQEGPVPNKTIEANMMALLPFANMLCMTPAASENVKQYRAWKTQRACGIAVDEAANMNRADLYCVWGNTLLPCFLFGDPKQLPPTVLSPNDKDDDGNHLNRFAKIGAISALLFLQAAGFPVYRLTTQLRMGKGLFDMVSGIMKGRVQSTQGHATSFDGRLVPGPRERHRHCRHGHCAETWAWLYLPCATPQRHANAAPMWARGGR